jgi:hypothetical protein
MMVFPRKSKFLNNLNDLNLFYSKLILHLQNFLYIAMYTKIHALYFLSSWSRADDVIYSILKHATHTWCTNVAV